MFHHTHIITLVRHYDAHLVRHGGTMFELSLVTMILKNKDSTMSIFPLQLHCLDQDLVLQPIIGLPQPQLGCTKLTLMSTIS